MNRDGERWFLQDALPRAGLCLDRHLIRGSRPAEGTDVITACGVSVVVSPSPDCDVDGDLALFSVRPCWLCVEQATGDSRPYARPRPDAEGMRSLRRNFD
ncbi:hypothetical protein TL08_12945 [Actinoalloteichus hymeniacidonis]|uniref:Uncharacterized protein n=2 Tax=Actinoalloteichus hymeniacidonis TaxID=340345 RepID=A0AAC9MXM1_9PSEU|nr:hypothetical protein TL08_12945 [Actinoalloteichus hymeniacidonis]